jgi:hypothetical protein
MHMPHLEQKRPEHSIAPALPPACERKQKIPAAFHAPTGQLARAANLAIANTAALG